uniref:Putative secreted protein n=1 Tax=Anopheles darlingi TaxID=43151 RepID=A0A2M4DCH1_ANODA
MSHWFSLLLLVLLVVVVLLLPLVGRKFVRIICFISSFEIRLTWAVSRNHRLNQCPSHTSPHSHCSGLLDTSSPPSTLLVPTASHELVFG